MTPAERKKKVKELFNEHEGYFTSNNIKHPLYIPKMAYRPPGKDEKHISFFPSELQKGEDIYTEFVSIDYDSEDPKRTLYFLKHNPHWSEEYELVTSKSGHARHIIPIGELKVINDINSRTNTQVASLADAVTKLTTQDININNPETERTMLDVAKGIEKALIGIQNLLRNINRNQLNQ
tara:strand:- start:2015 stop:2551 length:537 start_codon:yes stop_codon:yes gene_type:complete